MEIVLIVLALWLGCGVINAGLYYAHFQRRYPTLADKYRHSDTAHACGFALFGPIALSATIMSGLHRHGWLMPGTTPSPNHEGK